MNLQGYQQPDHFAFGEKTTYTNRLCHIQMTKDDIVVLL